MYKQAPLSVLWFGTGSMTRELLPAVNHNHLRIAAFVDEQGKFPRFFEGKPVISPAKIIDYDYNYIFVACRPAELVIARLVHTLAVPPEKIISLDFEDGCLENIFDPAQRNFEYALEAYLFAHPGLHEAFFLYKLRQSSWLREAQSAFDKQGRYDDAFFTGCRIETPEKQAQDFFHALQRPLALAEPPVRLRSMQIETTAHCGYRCFCCASHSAKRRKGVMSKEDVSLLAKRVRSYSGAALLHHGGEPLLDTELPEKVRILRQAWPDARLTFVSTLGVPVSTGYFDALWKNGLNDMEISHYGHDRETYQTIHGVDKFELARSNLHYLLSSQARLSHGGKLRIRMLHMEENSIVNPADYLEQAATFRAMVQSHAGVKADDTYLSSHSGQGSIKRQRATILPCSVVWGDFGARINVTWDMNLVPCCQDFDNHIVFGNLRHSSLEEIFSGPVYRDFVRASWEGDFSCYPLCQNCERHAQGNKPETLRIFAWNIAKILLNLPDGHAIPFAITGEPRFAPVLEAFFKRHCENCIDFTQLCKLGSQGKITYLFIAASGKAQLDYYDNIQQNGLLPVAGSVHIIPLNGISYYMETDLALRMRQLYETNNLI